MFFGKINQDYCLYFYFLMVISFIILLFLVFGLLKCLLINKFNIHIINAHILGLVTYFLVYFQSRLLYSMCHMHY